MPAMNGAKTSGMVVLIGAGPGDASLLTLAGADWLSKSQAVVYDRLVSPELLGLAPESAERIYVGKAPDHHTFSQEQIHDLLIDRARAGLVVARLKGGDPFIFGRGGEEAAALRAAGVQYVVVPGVTAAVAGCAYAGIPLTDRRCASSVAFVTGHEDPAKAESSVDFQALAGVDSVVFYMGVGQLDAIATAMISAGKPAETPTAVIERATTARQRCVRGTLATIASGTREANVQPPALIVIGEVVALGEPLQWRPELPLAGQSVLVTRARRQASRLAAQLGSLGAEVIEAPTIEILEPNDWTGIDASLSELGSYEMICFTSVNGVEAFCRRLMVLGLDGRDLHGARIAAIGSATAEALAERLLRADVLPEVFTSDALAEALRQWGDLAGKRVLLARADIAGPGLARNLVAAGAAVTDLTLYRTARPAALPPHAVEAIVDGKIDWVTFTSSSTADNFVDLVRPLAERKGGLGGLLSNVRLASIGPVTSGTLRRHGLEPSAEADPHTIDGLVDAIHRKAHRSGEPGA